MNITLIKNTSNSKILDTGLDNTLEFKTIDIKLNEFSNFIAKNFILSRPLIKDGIFRRKKEYLQYDINCGYIILDLDDITSKSRFNQIIQYFKNTKWECVICNSRSFNYIDCFNLKVLCRINYEATDDNLQNTLLFFKEQLSDWCSVDESVIRGANYQAPSISTTTFYICESGIGIPFSILPKTSKFEKIELELDDKEIKWCYNYITNNLGGKVKPYESSYSVTLPNEVKSKGSYFWYKDQPFTIFHPNPQKIIQLLPEYVKTTGGKQFVLKTQTNLINKELEFTPDFIENKQFIQNINLPDNRVIMIKSAMGTGKSNIVKQYIRNKSKVLFISVRQTLAKDIAVKYNCKHYIDDKNIKYGDNYVVQINSLFKINLDYFDYVVLDEFESLLMYFVNSVKDSKFIISILRKFNYILKTKNLLILDALLSDHSKIFPDSYKYLNEYKDNSNVFLYKNKNTFFNILENICLTKDKNSVITMSFSTLDELNTIKKLLISKNLKCIVITSDTNRFVRDNIFMECFNKDEVEYDCILFSPSITVGLSIMNNVTHHFHFDNSNSIDALTSIQMIRRSRKSKNIHIFVTGSTNSIYVSNNESFELDEIQDLEALQDLFNYFYKFYSTIELNHTISFTSLLKNQFSNISIVDKISNKKYEIIRKEKTLNLGEFESSPIKDELLNSSEQYIERLHNFIFYIKTSNFQQYLENYLTSNPNELIETSYKVKFVKYCIQYPNIKLKKKFIKSELHQYKTDFFTFEEFLQTIGYKKQGYYYLPHKQIEHVKKLINK